MPGFFDYHKNFNDKMKCYSNTPSHDQWSHGADAWRYLAIARRMFGKSGVLTSARIRDMRENAMGGKVNKPPQFPHESPDSLTFL